MESPEAPLPVFSQPRFPPAAGEDNSLSRPAHTVHRGPDAEVLDRVFADTWASWPGETLGNRPQAEHRQA